MVHVVLTDVLKIVHNLGTHRCARYSPQWYSHTSKLITMVFLDGWIWCITVVFTDGWIWCITVVFIDGWIWCITVFFPNVLDIVHHDDTQRCA